MRILHATSLRVASESTTGSQICHLDPPVVLCQQSEDTHPGLPLCVLSLHMGGSHFPTKLVTAEGRESIGFGARPPGFVSQFCA